MRSLILLLALLPATAFAQTTNKGTIKVKKAPAAGTVYAVVDQMPGFPGGESAMLIFIQANVRYPQSAIDSMRQGTSYITFVVELDGSMSDIKVLKGAPGCPECDQEAIRVVSSISGWRPGMQNGSPVRTQFNLPIRFRIR
ncbi:MAG: TonB family C-terminal domain [Bacteroidetes bacterium]|nr:TonB family C-terminal domain [Bacteroidota bacterium]